MKHVEPAGASRAWRPSGAVANGGAVQEVQLAVASGPDEIDVAFWRAVLSYDPLAPDNGVDPAPARTSEALW